MQSSFRAISLACAFAGTLGFCAGCSQGEGDRCEVLSDCASGLVCSFTTGSPHNGTCKPTSNPGPGGNPGQDAAGGGSAVDAATDGPALVEDATIDDLAVATDSAAGVDAAVVADGATVGADTSPDAEAAADLLSTD